MTSSNNPWIEVFSQPQQKSTEGIISFFEQAKMLTEASDGNVKGFFLSLRT